MEDEREAAQPDVPMTAAVPSVPSAPSVLIAVLPSPRRAWWQRWWVGALAVVILAAGTTGIALAARSDHRDAAPRVSGFSLRAALDRLTDGDPFSFRRHIDGVQSFDGTGVMDPASRVMIFRPDTTALLGEDIGYEVIADLDGKVMYMSTEPLRDTLPDDVTADWIRFTLDDLAGATDSPLLGDLDFSGPLDVAQAFSVADATDLGLDDVGGEPVRHYRIDVPTEDAVDASNDIASVMGDRDSWPETIAFDVYVTGGGELRVVRFGLQALGADVVEFVTAYPGTADPVTLPDESDVIDLADLNE